MFLVNYHQRLFEREYQPKAPGEGKLVPLSKIDTEAGEELEEQLVLGSMKKESFKDIFSFDNFKLMIDRIN